MAADILQSGQVTHTLKNWIRCQNRDPESGLKTFNCLLNQLDGEGASLKSLAEVS
jgi:hypothetical protein